MLGLAVIGCTSPQVATNGKTPGPLPESTEQIKSLQKENVRLKTRNLILTSRLDELSGRDNRLSEQIARLRSLNAKQQEQIKALTEASDKQDAYKKESEKLTLEVSRLRKRIAELERQITVLRPGRFPTTRAVSDGYATGGTAGD